MNTDVEAVALTELEGEEHAEVVELRVAPLRDTTRQRRTDVRAGRVHERLVLQVVLPHGRVVDLGRQVDVVVAKE